MYEGNLRLLLGHPGELCEEQPHGVLHGAQLVGAAEAQQVRYELIRQLQRPPGPFALPTLQLAVGVCSTIGENSLPVNISIRNGLADLARNYSPPRLRGSPTLTQEGRWGYRPH